MVVMYTYALPDTLSADIAAFEDETRRFLEGELAADIYKAKRVPRGIYEQRRDNTYMMRVRLPGGVLPASQASALARIARRYSRAPLHITTRQDIQLHDLAIADTPGVMRELMAAGLTSKGGGGNTVRNVATCPHAGVCPCETFDVTPQALAVTEHLIALQGSYNLPRKFKIAFSGCAVDCGLAEVNDVGFLAKVQNGQPGFVLYAGGGMGAESRVADLLSDWIPAEQATSAAEALRRVFAREGDSRNRKRARLRFAVERIGVAAFRDMFAREQAEVMAEGVPPAPRPPTASPQPPTLALVTKHGLRVLPQQQPGYVTVPVYPPLGLLDHEELEALAHIAERFAARQELRTMADQHLELRFVREEDLPALHAAMERSKRDWITPRPVDNYLACAGAATCRLGLCLSREAATACDDALAAADGMEWELLKHLDVRISGCPNACGQHPVGTIGLSGVADRVAGRLVPSYDVWLGARRGAGRTRLGRSAGLVPARALPAFMKRLVTDFAEQREPNEPFADYYDRRGHDYFAALTTPFTSVPAYADQPAFYRDWGEEQDFSLAGRGPGECGAGVFELITDDIAMAKRALEEADDHTERLYDAIVAASRALLITRGIETHEPDAVLQAFQLHFIETGLVFAEAWLVVEAARAYRALTGPVAADREDAAEVEDRLLREALALRALLHMRHDAGRLVDRVEFLFTKMDPELRFQVPEADAASDRMDGPAVVEEMDLRGVGCPANFIQARLRLQTLPPGSTLTLLLDAGAPATKVPVSMERDGYAALQTTACPEGHYRVAVRKPD